MAIFFDALRTNELVNGTRRTSFAKLRQLTRTLTTGQYQTVTQRISAAGEETIGFDTDGGTPWHVILENLDETNYVDVGFATGDYVFRLYPRGQDIPTEFSVDGADTLFLLANTAACDVEMTVISD